MLSGLNYIKGKNDPVALADDAYPEWLWNCLEVMKKADSTADADAGDEFCAFFFLPFSPPPLSPYPSPSPSRIYLVTDSTRSQIQKTAAPRPQAQADARSAAAGVRRPGGAGAQDPAAEADGQLTGGGTGQRGAGGRGGGQARGAAAGDAQGAPCRDQGEQLPQGYVKLSVTVAIVGVGLEGRGRCRVVGESGYRGVGLGGVFSWGRTRRALVTG